ncbi:carboxypeptidase-like regulatory domain-containing protein [Myroides sp. C15-4]|uniref:carboxypeptidase-like regulatory domain-containing protein n=1 Tax=Myroides sp. C15-4 TaxID=3400532 RepID=UPI003D2F7A9F
MAKYSIQIPEPCSEDWNQMTPLAKGRHCAVCQKTIYDFSNYTQGELVQHIQREGKICGRVPTKYLDIALSESKANRGISLQGIVAAAINLLVLTTTAAVQGQEKAKVEQHVKDRESVREQEQVEKLPVVIRGKVMDEEGLGLPGVSVIIRGTQLGVGTDMDGNFELKVPEEHKEVDLVFLFIGMEDYLVTIVDFDTPLLVTLKDILRDEEEVRVTTGLLIFKKKKRWLFF